MSRVCSVSLSLAALLVSLTPVHGEERQTPRTDLYGDPLPPVAVARMGTVQLRHSGAEIVFSKDGKTLISAGIDGTVRRWDVATGKQLDITKLIQNVRERESIKCVALAPGGSVVAVWRKDGLFLHDTGSGRRRTRLAAGQAVADGDFILLTFSRDGKSLVVLHDPLEGKSSLQLWDLVRGEQRPIPSLLGTVRNVAISPNGKHAAARTDSELFLWESKTGELLGSTSIFRGWGLAFSPDAKTLAVAEDGQLTLRDPATLEVRGRLNSPEDFLNAVVYSTDGRWLAAGGSKGVTVWDTAGRQKPCRLGDQQVFNLALALKGETLAWRSWGSTIHLWDVASGRPLHNRPGHSSGVMSLAASPDGKLLASGAPYDSRLLLWDADTGQLRYSLHGPDSEIGVCVFSPDGQRVIAASGKSLFQIWDTTTGQHLHRFRFQALSVGNWGIFSPHLSSDGKRLSAICFRYGSGERDEVLASSWNVDTGKLLSRRPYAVERHWRKGDRRASSWLDLQASFTPDARAVTARAGRTCNLEDVATGRVLARFPTFVGPPMTFSPDGRLAAAAVLELREDPYDGYDMKGLCLIETATGQEVFRINSGEHSWSGFSLSTPPLLAFTPDTQGIVLADSEGIRVWETATSAERFRQRRPTDLKRGQDRQPVCSLAVLPGDRAATGMGDGTILVWNLRRSTASSQRSEPSLDQAALDKLWSDLSGDAGKAHRAIYRLAAKPEQAMPLLRARLHPAEATQNKRVEKLLAALDSEQFTLREAATKELIQLRDRIEPRLQRSLENKPSAEARKRLQNILGAASPTPPTNTLRSLRAIAALECMGTPEARRLLEKLAGGAVSPETWAAQAALQRLKHRDAGTKGRSAP